MQEWGGLPAACGKLASVLRVSDAGRQRLTVCWRLDCSVHEWHGLAAGKRPGGQLHDVALLPGRAGRLPEQQHHAVQRARAARVPAAEFLQAGPRLRAGPVLQAGQPGAAGHRRAARRAPAARPALAPWLRGRGARARACARAHCGLCKAGMRCVGSASLPSLNCLWCQLADSSGGWVLLSTRWKPGPGGPCVRRPYADSRPAALDGPAIARPAPQHPAERRGGAPAAPRRAC